MSHLSPSLNIQLINFSYQHLLKPLLFQFPAEPVHNAFTSIGQLLGTYSPTRSVTNSILGFSHPSLTQKIAGINFVNPVGLSAGFDYDGHLTSILGEIGFGFESVGTVTFSPYQGNPPPRLDRLPLSKSLLVNKGFKSQGINQVLDQNITFINKNFQIGISIGATNSKETSIPKTQKSDIINSFIYLLSHPLAQKFAYYELNISCPNVAGSGSLANPKDLKELLQEINKLKPKKPLFIKYALETPWPETKKLIGIMINQGVSAIILSNLLKNRQSSTLHSQEIKKFKKFPGNFSGKPTWSQSNHLIGLTYQHFGQDLHIIGVGGIFSPEDAYEKIKLGSSLVQLITGMIYQGPGLISHINQGLVELLHHDGYTNVSEAVGSYYRHK